MDKWFKCIKSLFESVFRPQFQKLPVLSKDLWCETCILNWNFGFLLHRSAWWGRWVTVFEPAVPHSVETWAPWMKMALLEAKASPDPSTQNGAVLLSHDLNSFVRSRNEFPFGVSYHPERWERPAKYSYVEHAERNSYYKAAYQGMRTLGSTLVCPWAACHDCARAIIQSGTMRLVRLQISDSCSTSMGERWQESMSHADTMMIEAGVEIIELDLHFGVALRRDGKMVEF